MDEYFRRDQKDQITAPDPSKQLSFSEHIVKARGKKTQYTSVCLNPQKCMLFGQVTYKLLRPDVDDAGHSVIEHNSLVETLRAEAKNSSREEKVRAIQALRYAQARAEGLVQWSFNLSGVEPKNYITFASPRVQVFFKKV